MGAEAVSRWFRWYEGTSEDGKFRVVARNANVTVATVMGVWATLLEDASHSETRGIAGRGEPFYCAILDLDEATMVSILSAMEGVELISVGPGAITITKWKERQFETDTVDPTNAERQRRFRDKRKHNCSETERNGTVTVAKRPDTDTDTDTEKKKERSRPNKVRTIYGEDFENGFWKPYPRTPIMSKAEAFRQFEKLSEDDRTAAIAAVPAYCAWLKSKPDHPAVHACRFLSQRRFDGFTGHSTGPPGQQFAPPPGQQSLEEIRAKYRKPNAEGYPTEIRCNAGLGENGADHGEELSIQGRSPLRDEIEREAGRAPDD